MSNLKAFYDEEVDVLYIAREGVEEEVVEVSPWINLEMDSNREIIGMEILEASKLLRNVMNQMTDEKQVAAV